jgi:hypothetical protein
MKDSHFVRYSLLIALFCLFWINPLRAEEKSRSVDLKIEIAVNAETGWPSRLIVTGYNPQSAAWLGMSLYPYDVADPIAGGRHSITEIKKGEIDQIIPIDPALLGGSFEFAIWGKKVLKTECTRENCYWCKTYGYHVEESLIYKSGLLTRLTGYK